MFIDTHTHYIDGDWLCSGKLSLEDMAETAAEFGIKELWMSSTGALTDDFVFYNRNMYEKTRPFTGLFRNFASASPYYQDKAITELRRCIEDYGFWGIKVHYWTQGGTVHMKTSADILELAIRYRMPVLYHDGTPPTSDTMQIAYLADRYPEAKIILGHAGMYDSAKCAIEACNTHENIYLCISCATVETARDIIANTRPDRLLFGSDYGAAETRDVFTDRVDTIRYACRDEAARETIFHGNAEMLLKELGAPALTGA